LRPGYVLSGILVYCSPAGGVTSLSRHREVTKRRRPTVLATPFDYQHLGWLPSRTARLAGAAKLRLSPRLENVGQSSPFLREPDEPLSKTKGIGVPNRAVRRLQVLLPSLPARGGRCYETCPWRTSFRSPHSAVDSGWYPSPLSIRRRVWSLQGVGSRGLTDVLERSERRSSAGTLKRAGSEGTRSFKERSGAIVGAPSLGYFSVARQRSNAPGRGAVT
jgi:hypothetical protein